MERVILHYFIRVKQTGSVSSSSTLSCQRHLALHTKINIVLVPHVTGKKNKDKYSVHHFENRNIIGLV